MKTLFIDHVGFGPELSYADPWSQTKSLGSVELKKKYYNMFISRMRQDSPTYIVRNELELLRELSKQEMNFTDYVPTVRDVQRSRINANLRKH
jgi:hypothetical protein